MAAGGDGEHTRYPFLAIVRYTVATVVTVLTVVVVGMVITVALRPEEIRLSISRGYILADPPWWLVSVNGSGYYRGADSVNLRVYLSAHNPSGRASVRCTITAIRILDMPNAPYFTGMVEIARCNFKTSENDNSVFYVPRQTSHSLRKRVVIDDENALLYIFKQYAGRNRFSALVEVNATVSYEPLLSTKQHNVSQLHYCWPVTVGYDILAADAVSCKKRDEIDGIPNSQLPAPAPAPVPADGN